MAADPHHKTKSQINVAINTHNRSSIDRVELRIHTLHPNKLHNEHKFPPVCFPRYASLRGSVQ